MKKVSSLKLGIILLVIAAICGLVLGEINEITKEPIAVQQRKTLDEANKEILPQAKKFEEKKDFSKEGIILSVTEGKDGSDLKGYTIKVGPKGYGGELQMMVGVSTEGKVTGIKILEHSETPGLGANAPQPKFSGQFKNKPAKQLEVVKASASKDNEIQAITGATITSRAVTSGVNEAIKFYDSKLKGGK